MALAFGCPGTEIPYSVSLPITRCTLMTTSLCRRADDRDQVRARVLPGSSRRGTASSHVGDGCDTAARLRLPVRAPRAHKYLPGTAQALRCASQVLHRAHRYCPVLLTVSIERPVSAPFFPETRVRMNTIRSPFLPEMRAQSSGLVVLGRSSFSLNSSTQAPSRWETRRPFCPWSRKSLIADFFARSTMFWIIAPELKSLK